MWLDQGGSKAESPDHQVQWKVEKVGFRRSKGTGEDVRLLPAINRAVIICVSTYCMPRFIGSTLQF